MVAMRMHHTIATIAALLLTTAPSALPAQVIAITGGKVYPVSGPPIENGTVIVRDGRIVAVGANLAVPPGAQRIDATGRWVTPGLINPGTALGLNEAGTADTRDTRARGRDQVAAAFRVWEGYNPASVLLAPARDEGITTVLLFPSGGLIYGQAAVMDLVEGSMRDGLLRAPVAMVGQIGSAQAANAGARGEVLVRMRELLEDVRAYQRNRAAYDRGDTREFAASRLDLEAMIPVLEGRLPLVLEVDRAADIETALDLAKEYDLRLMIAGGAEAWKVAAKLATARVPVLTGAVSNIPGSFASLNARQENAGLLRAAGVTVALLSTGSGGDAFNVRNIRQDAGNAIAFGMTWDDALRAVTQVPAQLFGVDEQVGSLQVGRQANVVVWSGDPFEFGTRAERVLVRGREIVAPSRQEELEQRYRTLPPAYRGTPPGR